MNKNLKTSAIRNIETVLTVHMKLEHPNETRVGSFSLDPEIKQGLTLHEILDEIKRETPTGELWAKVWAVRLY